MKNHILTAGLYTVITAVLLGIVYPLLITGISQATMRDKANGQLITQNGETIGSALIGQPFHWPCLLSQSPIQRRYRVRRVGILRVKLRPYE